VRSCFGIALACREMSRRGGGKVSAWSTLRTMVAKLAFVGVLCEVQSWGVCTVRECSLWVLVLALVLVGMLLRR